jgi:hypothetical protein
MSFSKNSIFGKKSLTIKSAIFSFPNFCSTGTGIFSIFISNNTCVITLARPSYYAEIKQI